MTDLSDHDEMELSTDNEQVRASTRDAADGLYQARLDRKLSNTAVGNNQIKTRAYGNAMGQAQRFSNKYSTFN